ncbi:uncharacterized protein [Zea mays]|uniref:Uncharacterized protein n=1 Tax=Zea mays TaxID=4577 RepID=C0PHQ6_MAIZE|nr:uncharacterized protein LOC111591197 [Zea mays]ACN34722.1 unknown [Zea mays]|eukprot:XP_023157906.1 uncharacterized protein LOC111591197 [Zea mays]
MQPLRACRPVVALHLKIPSAETRRKLLLPFAAAEGNRAPNREGLKSLSFASLLWYGAQSLVLVAPAPMNLRNAWPCSKTKTNKSRPLFPFVRYCMVHSTSSLIRMHRPLVAFLFFKRISFLWQVSAVSGSNIEMKLTCHYLSSLAFQIR